jgi:peptidyl-Lys metalloendopeptidase
VLLAVAPVLSACLAPGQTRMQETEGDMFGCTLETEGTYVIAAPVDVRFSLHNRTNRTLYVLTWYTPLEGIAGRIFRVTRDGDELWYQGILAKRGDPSRDDYITLEPGMTASALVNLAEVYDLSQPGRYRIEFVSRIHDVTDDVSSIPRKRDDHQPHELSCRAVDFELVRPSSRMDAG